MAEPWIRYRPTNEGNLYQPEKPELPYSKGLEPLAGVMETVDYLTTSPIRGGLSQAQKTGPWDFFKGAYNALRHPNNSPTATEVAKQYGVSDKPIFKDSGRLSFGGMASKLSPAQVGGFIGENVLDPSNLVPAGKAMALGGLAMGGLKKLDDAGDLLKQSEKLLNSQGNPVHPTAEGIDNFKKWFGESKVVDEKGQPIVAYHGTRNTNNDDPFNTFKNISGIKNSNEPKASKGFYFTPDLGTAESYAGGPYNGYVHEAYLDIKKPIDLRNEKDLKMALGSIGELKYLENMKVVDDVYGEGYFPQALEDVSKGLSHKIRNKIAIWAKKNNYDGLIMNDLGRDGAYVSYVPLSPTQIKSATGNSGKFNPKDPNILKAIAPVGPWMMYQNNRHERTQNDNRE